MTNLDELLEVARACVRRYAVPELLAANLEWDEARGHLRLHFSLTSIPEDVDLGQLELAMVEIIAACPFVRTAGTIYEFDTTVVPDALRSPYVVYSPYDGFPPISALKACSSTRRRGSAINIAGGFRGPKAGEPGPKNFNVPAASELSAMFLADQFSRAIETGVSTRLTPLDEPNAR